MNIDQLRKLCLSFPGTTEQIQWGDNLLFKVGGKMFAVAALEPAAVRMSRKPTPEISADFTKGHGLFPAPYRARAKWIARESQDSLPAAEIAGLLRESYELVLAKLPRKLRETVARGQVVKTNAKAKRRGKTKRRK